MSGLAVKSCKIIMKNMAISYKYLELYQISQWNIGQEITWMEPRSFTV